MHAYGDIRGFWADFEDAKRTSARLWFRSMIGGIPMIVSGIMNMLSSHTARVLLSTHSDMPLPTAAPCDRVTVSLSLACQ